MIHESIVRKLAWFNNGNGFRRIISLNGYTELEIPRFSKKNNKRNIIRAHPDYKCNGLWLDWIDVIWESLSENDDEEVSILPAQVVMILDFDSAIYEAIPEEIVNILPILSTASEGIAHQHRDGVHLLVHSADYKDEEDQKKFSIAKRFDMEPFFQLIDISNVFDIAFVARDPPSDNIEDDAMKYGITYVRQPSIWGNAFVPRLSQGYKDPDDEEMHFDEFNETHNPW
jgi:hypothetical protein